MCVKNYIKKPIVVKAIKYTLDSFPEVLTFLQDNIHGTTMILLDGEGDQYGLKIPEEEDLLLASLGDYIVELENKYCVYNSHTFHDEFDVS